MQSNFEQFMCSWDKNPKFSPFEGMTLALQAHLFNRLYQTRGTKLKFDTHLLHPSPTGTISDYLIYKFTASVCDGARVLHRRPTRPGPALLEYGPGPPRTPGFPPTGPAVRSVGSGPSQKADRAHPGTPHGCDEARRKIVVCV